MVAALSTSRPSLSPALATALVVLASASWGLWSLVLRPTGLPATVTAPLMMALVALWSLPAAWRAPPARWSRRARWLLLGNAGFDALNVVTFFAAMEHGAVTVAVLTHYAAPLLIALAAPWIDHQRVRGAPAAALLAMAGLALVLAPWRGDGAWVLGASLGLISALGYAGNTFTVRRLTLEVGAARALCYHAALGALLLAPMLAAGDGLAAVSLPDLGLLAAGTALLGADAGVAFLRGLVVIGATRAAMLAYCEPLVAVAVGALVWGETLAPLAALGAALVIAAGVWVARRPPEPAGPRRRAAT